MKKSSKSESIVKEYVRRIPDEDLSTIVERSVQPVCGDRADVSLIFQKDKEIDKWLCQSGGAFEWFDRVDLIEEQAVVELNRRQKIKESKDKK